MASPTFGRSAMPRTIFTAMALSLLAGTGHAAPPGVRHVRADAAAGGDGLTWATAYNDLRQALITAGASGGMITELWVKEGTYLPGPVGSSDRTLNFTLVNGVGVYGGFAGTEMEREERDPEVHLTTLSGHLGPVQVHNVVIGAGDHSTVLDGFTIRDGLAQGTPTAGTTWAGGGIHITGSPTIRGCTITANGTELFFSDGLGFARSGGGVFCAPGSAATIANCRIIGNYNSFSTAYRQPAGRGAGLAADGCSLTLIGCDIADNRGGEGRWYSCGGGQPLGGAYGGDGGGLHLSNAAVLIQDCRISGNSCGNATASPACGTITPCGRDGLRGGHGGGVYAANSAVTVIATTISGNFTGNGSPGASGYCATSGGDGGAGGGVYSLDSALMFINCVFDKNRTGGGGPWAGSYGAADGGSGGDGAGVWASSGEVHLINCTLAGGQLGTGQPGTLAGHGGSSDPAGADGEPGAGAAVFGSAVSLENCIAWNTGQPDELIDAVAAYSDIRGGYVGPGNIDADPLFIDHASDDFRLQSSSPCIDAGNSAPAGATLPATDLDGLPRRVDIGSVPDTGIGPPIVDMGAYEVQVACPIDFTGDGLVDFSDYLEFLNLYDAADPRADLTGDGLVDFSDYLEFLNLYDSGC